jgi:hypothetical protein
MKFGVQFEYHKIPEWYNMYLEYSRFNDIIGGFKKGRKKGKYIKLPFFYALTDNRAIARLIVEKIGDHEVEVRCHN